MTESQTQSAAAAAAATKSKPQKIGPTKTETLLNLLRTKRGASIKQLQQASGWQSHSVRGFLSGTVKKKLALTLLAETGNDGLKRYRIEENAAGK